VTGVQTCALPIFTASNSGAAFYNGWAAGAAFDADANSDGIPDTCQQPEAGYFAVAGTTGVGTAAVTGGVIDFDTPAYDTTFGGNGRLQVGLPANGDTTTISDDFVIGFPMGITVRTSDKYAFDLELVPAIQNDALHVGLTVHPGIVVALDRGWGAGVRMAFDVNEPSWGFTPILNHGLFKVGEGGTLFGELVVPIRFQSAGPNNTFTSVGIGVHLGVGF